MRLSLPVPQVADPFLNAGSISSGTSLGGRAAEKTRRDSFDSSDSDDNESEKQGVSVRVPLKTGGPMSFSSPAITAHSGGAAGTPLYYTVLYCPVLTSRSLDLQCCAVFHEALTQSLNFSLAVSCSVESSLSMDYIQRYLTSTLTITLVLGTTARQDRHRSLFALKGDLLSLTHRYCCSYSAASDSTTRRCTHTHTEASKKYPHPILVI